MKKNYEYRSSWNLKNITIIVVISDLFLISGMRVTWLKDKFFFPHQYPARAEQEPQEIEPRELNHRIELAIKETPKGKHGG